MESCAKCSSPQCAGILIAPLASFLAGGCYERMADGNQATYRFTWWIVALVAGGGFLAIAIGWKSLGRSERWGWTLIIVGTLMLIAFAPMMYFDRLLIDDAHFEQRSGIMGRKIHDIQFRSLREIHVVASRGARGTRKVELHGLPANGQMEDVLTGDLVLNAVPEILREPRMRCKDRAR